MKLRIIIVFALSIQALSAFSACWDLELRDRAFKTNIVWNYAPFYKPEVEPNFILIDSPNSPASIEMDWKNHPYRLVALIDVVKPTIADLEKTLLIKFYGENTDTGRKKEKTKIIQFEKGKAKASFYAPLSGISITLNLSEISLEEWIELEKCPGETTAELE